MVQYKNVEGFEGYVVYEDGTIISYKRPNPKVLKPYVAGNGYYEVSLAESKGKYKRLGLHRLIAQHFIPNPNNLKQVNHKDGNTLNYSLDNLEWVSASDNVMHSIYTLGNGNTKQIIVDGVKFKSLKECAKYFNINAKNLSSQLKLGIIPRALRGKELSFE